MPTYTPGKLVLARESQTLDADAEAYVNAVEVADGQRIEDPVRFAINDFVIGCKADGIWTAIKASCILAGARTLTGALVPLVGAAPTSFNFVSGDYNRKTGLVGDGSTKYLNSNRNNNADPQDSIHASVYASSVTTNIAGNPAYLGRGAVDSGSLFLGRSANTLYLKTCRFDALNSGGSGSTNGLHAVTRSASASYVYRVAGTNSTVNATSQAPFAGDIAIFASNRTPALNYSNGRLAFYSIGESLDLALLDARVTALINAFAAAIP